MRKLMIRIKSIIALGMVFALTTNSFDINQVVMVKAQENSILSNSKIEAEAFDQIYLASTEQIETPQGENENSEGDTQAITRTGNGSYTVYNNIDFGGNTTVFTARYDAESDFSGEIELWIDSTRSPDNTLSGGKQIGTFSTTSTDFYQTGYCNLDKPVSGVHNLYLVFKPDKDSSYTCKLNWFYFSKKINSIEISEPTKVKYHIGESIHAYNDVVIKAKYSDGTTGYEYIGKQEITGFNSTKPEPSQQITIAVRGYQASYPITILDDLLSITTPNKIPSVENGTPKTESALGLPSKVSILTLAGKSQVEVKWKLDAAGYDPAIKHSQDFKVTGSINLPQGVDNTKNLSLEVIIDVHALQADGFQFSFMSISDIHISSASKLSSNTFQKRNLLLALQDASYYKCGLISVVGDLTENGFKSEYSNLKQIMDTYNNITTYYTMGNHDVRYQSSFSSTVKNFNQGTGMSVSASKPYYDKWINGYHFIYLCTESNNKDSAYISDTQISWLDKKLSEKSVLSKPIFVFLHQPISLTLPTKTISNVSISDSVQDKKLLEVLGKYPQSILFNGHIHNELVGGRTLYNAKSCTMLRDGAAGKGSDNKGTDPEGMIVDVYSDKIVVNGRHFAKKTTIYQTTIMNHSNANLLLDKQAPTAPKNLSVTHKTDKQIMLSWEDSVDEYSTKYNNVGLAGYDIYKDGKYFASTRAINTYVISGLKSGTTYQFLVKAKDLAGNCSNCSNKLTVRTLYSNDAPSNLALKKSVKTSTTASGYSPSLAVDGKVTTKWISTKAYGSEWITVDFGKNYEVSRWVVKNAAASNDLISNNAKNYRLLGSTDGKSWTVLDTVFGNVSNVTDRYFDRKIARYVKLLYDNPSNYDEKVSSIAKLCELEVYGGNIFKEIITPTSINGLPYGVEKTAKGLNLPEKVSIQTSSGKILASVNWNMKNVSYDKKSTKPQTIQINGTVSLPAGVINPDNIKLNTMVKVTVSGEKLMKLTSKSNNLTVYLGKPQQISYQGILKSGKVATIPAAALQFKNSNNQVATVSTTGMITPKAPGKTTIKIIATINGVKLSSKEIQVFIPSNDASLSKLTVDGKTLDSFQGTNSKYYIVLPSTHKKIPKLKGTTTFTKAKITISNPSKLPGTAKIKVIAQDQITIKTYTVKYGYDKISSVKLTIDHTKIKKGGYAQLCISGYLKNKTVADVSSGKISYVVSNRKVLSVDKKGKLKGMAKGTAKVKVRVTLNGVTRTSNNITIKIK